MTQHIIPAEFFTIDIELEPFFHTGEVQEIIVPTIAKLFGWYDAGKTWKRINTDNQGRALVSLNAGQTSTGSLTKTVITNVATRVLVTNLNRRSFVLQNTGTFIISLGVDNTVLTTTGLQLPPGASFNDATYVGEIWCICSGSTGEVRTLEL